MCIRDSPNALTIAWTGILNSQPPKTYISVRPERYSYDLIKESGEFVINQMCIRDRPSAAPAPMMACTSSMNKMEMCIRDRHYTVQMR